MLGDVRVVIADSTTINVGNVVADRYIVVPPLSDAEGFADTLERIVGEESIDLVFPCTNRELTALAELKPRFATFGARVAVPSSELLKLLDNKSATYRELLLNGIPAQSPLSPAPTSPFPLLGKPQGGWGGRGFEVVRQWEDFQARRVLIDVGGFCWVPLLPMFEEFSADFAIGFHANISAITMRHRLRTSSGFAVVSDSSNDPDVYAISLKVASWLASAGGCGLFNIQVLRTPDLICLVSDINPRHGTSSGHAAATGNNLVAFMAGIPSATDSQPMRTVRVLEQRATPIPNLGTTPYKGVVFDLDDTLIDHKRWIMDRMRVAADGVSDVVAPAQLIALAYDAVEEGHYDSLIDRVVKGMGLPALRDRLLASYRSATPASVHVFPEVEEALLELRRAKIRVGLLTDNPPESQLRKLSLMRNITCLLDAIVFTREQGLEKPSPSGFLNIARRLDVSPGDLLMVGDNVARDAVGAINAGYSGCLLLKRPSARFQADVSLLARCRPDVARRVWTSPDLRTLTSACGLHSFRTL